jgi:phosphatidylglycerol---prolipoprotein diacylglyceryl transferase
MINVPIVPTCDLVAIYAPLLQAIARLGCFTAGCCHGTTTTSIFGIIYTNIHSLALQNITIHPTQLYSSITLLMIFFYMYYRAQYHHQKTGQLFATYLMLVSLERFFLDFLRADRIMITQQLSMHQLIALALMATGCTLYFISNRVDSVKKT